MVLLKLSILLCMILFSPSLSGATSPTNIFILAGQSNMAGRGGVEKIQNGKLVWDGKVPLECQSDPSILRLNPERQWEIAHEPLHLGIDISHTPGIGPGIPFAHQFKEKAGQKAGTVGLVPCARGGTLIEQWIKNPSNPSATFYQNFIERIKTSEKEGGVVRALFWYQGESDAAMNDTAQRYKDNLKKFITDIRNDIKPRFLPVIIVKISMYDFFMKHDTHNLPAVRAAEDAVQKELPDIITIDSRELPINLTTFEGFSWDHGHFNTETEIVLGKWLADTYLAHYGHLL
ncbi:probable carbohydrate esterase At4g34215 [Cucurbita pepo subsp. pepo]|uniref:probable carbohydrate esterase At4g34215 isoform X2 n=1 Tax=Cucurbita pepo subsp. pepo TaxID=3664 RepID=UPI000C9D5D09|nr:probable carbohydrate esterase At4g34215 isoform X2 [Cucurbita pepo subsp. pepo]XP_023536888.1 probable carbohydrate esterase At4g34215 isoform X2 [Cucurbita pepo subsp. pepo]XP_023536889.1 probable carbohydrate esterase At4g34215 isoform X2 [Cucurbita pepo subsp. pepo]XP_023536890.1 probable carbohydrate esterase At4g34215 isoform X2 [Cucurbita pepo subsp. pepo]XP_023537924.1 probable carbohydrate esterase At4g34215 [Cucurbita pepo subsp. pepo]